MRTPRIYVGQPLICNARIELSSQASHHLSKVLRRRSGQPLYLFNGEGGYYSARLAESVGRSLFVEVLQFHADDRESPLCITLAQGISRGARMDYTLQKAVELGATRVVPVLSEFSNLRLDTERTHRRLEHWRGIIIGACEQSGRNRLPELLPSVSFADWIREEPGAVRLILHHRASARLGALSCDARPVVLLCGPEGGFSEAEIRAAVEAGYVGIRIGPRVLRTETAAVAALAACQSRWGDLG